MILSLKEKGETRFFDPISFSPSEKETVSSRQRKRGRGETFRMVSPHPFYRPEPCSGLAAYGSQKIYDRVCRGRCRAQLFATKERYRCGLPLAGTHRPASAILHRAIVFECRGGRLCPPAKAPSASEEACCIPFPPGRRKLHIRSLLLPSQIVTVSLGHNLAIWNFTTPHAILMMAGRRQRRAFFMCRKIWGIRGKKMRRLRCRRRVLYALNYAMPAVMMAIL